MLDIIDEFFIDNIFVGKEIEDLNTVIYSLKNGIPVYNIYIICVYRSGRNIAQIITSRQFLKEIGGKNDIKAIGIAHGKYSARKLFAEILEYWISAGKTVFDFRDNIIGE